MSVGAAPYLVRWKDGHESVFMPSSGTLGATTTASPGRAGASAPARAGTAVSISTGMPHMSDRENKPCGSAEIAGMAT